jgi:hypothetical protein
MSDIKRCDECGSWGVQCISDTPVPGCGCQRCAHATIRDFRRQLEESQKDAERYRYWRNGDGIALGDAPPQYAYGEELDQYTDECVARQEKNERKLPST